MFLDQNGSKGGHGLITRKKRRSIFRGAGSFHIILPYGRVIPSFCRKTSCRSVKGVSTRIDANLGLAAVLSSFRPTN